MLVFSTPLVNCCPFTISLTFPTPTRSKIKRTVYSIQIVCGCGGVGVLSCVVDHILQEFKHSISDQIQNLQNCYTTPNKNTRCGGRGLSTLISLF
jgi:hypothetical protein